jgi:probable phosphoglycerate mutase
MNHFYIARHGETENNKARRLSGWIDTPLTASGLVPTQVAIKKLQNLHISEIYSSDLGRAFITAYEIARGLQFTNKIITSGGLREVNYGDAANMYSADAYQQYPELDRNTHYTPPGGESLEHMQARVLQCVNAIDESHTDEVILLVAHSGVMAALNANYRNEDFGAHNISEAYPHEYIGHFTMNSGNVALFEEFV